jgi:Zn-dependent peptidase ImmA (M78 family)
MKLPIDIESLAKDNGINAIRSEDMEDSVAGFLLVKDHVATIALNKNHTLTRKRFYIAYFLADYLLYAKGKRDHLNFKQRQIYNRNLAHQKPDDIQTLRMAAEILMPEKPLIAELKKEGELFYCFGDEIDLLSTLSKLFNVSRTAISQRIYSLVVTSMNKNIMN